MSTKLIPMLFLLLAGVCSQAQTTESIQLSVAAEGSSASALPNMPRPQQSKNYVQGRRWRDEDFKAPFHLDEPDRSWGRAMRHPPVLGTSAALVGLTAIQLIKTDRCITENKPACNLITGKNRAAAYALNIPLNTGVVYLLGRMKQRGNITGFLLLGMAAFTYDATVAYTANPHVLVCLSGRVPQCQ